MACSCFRLGSFALKAQRHDLTSIPSRYLVRCLKTICFPQNLQVRDDRLFKSAGLYSYIINSCLPGMRYERLSGAVFARPPFLFFIHSRLCSPFFNACSNNFDMNLLLDTSPLCTSSWCSNSGFMENPVVTTRFNFSKKV
jgi:hypothetical protein